MHHVPVGYISLFKGPDAPPRWLPTDGRSVRSREYPELREVLGLAFAPRLRDRLLHRLRGTFPLPSLGSPFPWAIHVIRAEP